jgi:hypothetical protein
MYPHAKFHIPSLNDSLITIKPTCKCRFHIVAIINVLYSKKNYHNRSCIFFEVLLSYVTSSPYIKWCYCCSDFTVLCICHVVIAYCRKLKCTGLRVASSDIMFIPDFMKIGHSVQKLKGTHTHAYACLRARTHTQHDDLMNSVQLETLKDKRIIDDLHKVHLLWILRKSN